jgi:hypothetical protein
MKPDVIHVKACELLARDKIKVRVQDLKAAHRERHEITVDDLVAELEEARAMATKIESASAMVAASMGKAKLLGLVVDKGELTGKNGEPLNPPRELTDLESARRVAFILEKGLRRLKEGDKEALTTADVLRFKVANGADPMPHSLGAAVAPRKRRIFDTETGELEDA